MEKILSIIKEVNEKKGREWLSLHPKTEQQLMTLAWYLTHPKLQEDPEKIEEIVELYYNAKANNFLHMEKITRKLDELSVKIGNVGPIEKITFPSELEKKPIEELKQPTIVDYAKAIEDLRNRIERLLNSPFGSNLLENTQVSISTFLHYLNHPDLQNNTELFDEMLEKYEEVEAVEFTTMQTFNDLLNKMKVRLGKLPEEIKKWKSIDEREKESLKQMEKIAEEKQNLKEDWEALESERNKLKLEWEQLEVEKGNMLEEQKKFNQERQQFDTERTEMTLKQAEINQEQSKLESEKQKDLVKEREKIAEEKQNLKEGQEALETERNKLKLEWEQLEVEKGNWIEEQEKFNEERQQFVTERAKLTFEQAELSLERSKVESEKEKLESVKKELEALEKKLENRLSKIP
ncbi:MAG: hypothetical protein ACFE9S_19265 [Candidatus Hermodarchaeota archaeon]